MSDKVEIITNVEALQAVNRVEIDTQIATAKQYPRNIHSSLTNIVALATMDQETAEECFYALRRGQGNDATLIKGLSVRMAEIFASSWGNLRVQTRIIGNDGKMITAQAMCHDLETNVAISLEVKRRITNRNGQTFSEDMQVVTGNAASAIAFRNAIFKVIPKAVTKKAIGEIKAVAIGKEDRTDAEIQKIFNWYHKKNVTTEQILEYLEVSCVEEITKEQYLILKSTANAIHEGSTSIKETFNQKTKSDDVKDKKAAMKNKKSNKKTPMP